ncbi:zinc-dependent metalloprotease [Nesterenkonia natronophila]|uniref:Hydrolase n=1 Tax=Nesterenkonia natronophila TaxID=2174932 RepID=A0A3A4F9W8_9MICC|nr:zinc-dependent metalloprotease [Nesterenkonia natronophila]RJN31614.1 hydrolase [Nesterenkonia natronophila]
MTSPADLIINWDVARSTASRLVPPGPSLSPAAAAREVADVRQAAAEAVGYVHTITGLSAAEGLGEDQRDVLVVDRPGWSAANTESFRKLLRPALDAVAEKKPQLVSEGSSAQVFGSAAAGAELGGILAFLSANVLGQFDPFHSSEHAPGGRLMLVAPNIVEIAKQLNVDRSDFRLWVCLHEQTHRVQFAAAPWLRDHLMSSISTLSSSTLGRADGLPQRIVEAVKSLRQEMGQQKVSDQHDAAAGVPARNRLLEVLQTPEDREIMSHLTAVMSLLEGHANVVMDAVDDSIVPTVKTIRRRFEQRGKNRSPLEKIVRKLLQLDVKAAQYRDGQKFVGHIVETIGMERFNTIWDSPEHLPSEEELHNPDTWIERMGYTPKG